MKIVAISDTHSMHQAIKAFQACDSQLDEEKEALGGDLIIHSGDALGRGTLEDLNAFISWYSELDFRYLVYVPGNHDLICETSESLVKQICKEHNVTYLNDSEVTIEGIRIYGMASQPYFFNWAFNRARNQSEASLYKVRLMKEFTDMIPEGIDILVTHGPAYGILDETTAGSSVGCQDTLEALRRVKPDLHIFGHIHNGYGQQHHDGLSSYNASICDERYNPINQPFVIEYEKESK